jgi:protein tyrosine kinase modulator
MLPGKKYTPEDILLILRRRIWLVLIPFAIVSAAAAVYARRLPDLYRSETLIAVIPPRVPEGFVRSAVASRIEDRLPAIQQQVLSRTRLERIIQDLNLYQEERRFGIMEDIVEQMRNRVSVVPVRGEAFRVQFVGGDPRTVMRVAERLSSLLIEESLRDREVLVEGTDQFLESQLDAARVRLVEHEKKVEAYRRAHAGELPGQIDSNLQAAQSRQTQIQQLSEAISRDQERRLGFERLLSDLERQDPTQGNVAADLGGPTAAQLTAARARLAEMQLTLKAEHPDVKRAKTVIRDLEAQLETEALSIPLSVDGGRRVSAGEQVRLKRIEDLRAQVETIDRQVAKNQGDIEKLRGQADTYLKRAEAGPTRETEMVELNRDYYTLQGLYTSLLGKKEESTISANLERRQIGEQFKLLDPARLPGRPFSPDRHQMNLYGMVAGLSIGLVLVALLEYRNVALQTDEELTNVVGLPVLAVVPVLESEQDRRRRIRFRMLFGTVFGGTVAGCLAIVLYTFVR